MFKKPVLQKAKVIKKVLRLFRYLDPLNIYICKAVRHFRNSFDFISSDLVFRKRIILTGTNDIFSVYFTSILK